MNFITKRRQSDRKAPCAQAFGALEPLEGRQMMAVHFPLTPPTYPLTNQTITVTNTNPNGLGSLYQAIQTADSSPFLNVRINFQIPGYNPTIALPTWAPLPAITRGSVTIDGTTQWGGVTIQGSYVTNGYYGTSFGVLLEASNSTIQGLNFQNVYTGIGVYGGSNNLFNGDTTINCGDGITLDSQSNNNVITNCTFNNSLYDGIYVGGQNNQIGAQQSAARTPATRSTASPMETASKLTILTISSSAIMSTAALRTESSWTVAGTRRFTMFLSVKAPSAQAITARLTVPVLT